MNVVELEDVTFRREGKEILQGISLTVREGEHWALLKGGRVVVAGAAREVLTTAHVSAAFDHPIRVTYADGRWGARAVARSAR